MPENINETETLPIDNTPIDNIEVEKRDEKSASKTETASSQKPKFGAMLADYPDYDPYKKIEEWKKERREKREKREKEMRQLVRDRLKNELKENKQK